MEAGFIRQIRGPQLLSCFCGRKPAAAIRWRRRLAWAPRGFRLRPTSADVAGPGKIRMPIPAVAAAIGSAVILALAAAQPLAAQQQSAGGSVAADTPAGLYQIEIGLYDGATGARLRLAPAGRPEEDEYLDLSPIRVAP